MTHGIAGVSGLAALLAGLGWHKAMAEATPAVGPPDERRPRRYVLTGEGIAIRFDPSTDRSEAGLLYRDADGMRKFGIDEIDIVRQPPLGLLVSVLIDAIPDAAVWYLTVLLPAVNPVDAGTEVPIQTVAIRTEQRTSIGGPALVDGQLQTYEVVSLEGVAAFPTPTGA